VSAALAYNIQFQDQQYFMQAVGQVAHIILQFSPKEAWAVEETEVEMEQLLAFRALQIQVAAVVEQAELPAVVRIKPAVREDLEL
jgi:hypothetical protein